MLRVSGTEDDWQLFRRNPSTSPINIGLDGSEPGVPQNEVSVPNVGQEESQQDSSSPLLDLEVRVIFDVALSVGRSIHVDNLSQCL